MVVVVQPGSTGVRRPAPMRTGRAAWLILAADGPATEVPDRVSSSVVRVIADPRRFRDVLLAERPRIVVCAEPPADAEALRLVAEERRRRTAMRAVHLAPPDAVAQRLAALALGFDDALTTTTDASELAGRLAWLEAKARARPGSPDRPHDRRRSRARPRGPRAASRWRGRPPAAEGVRAARAARRTSRAARTRAASCCTWSGGRRIRGGPRTVDVHVRWLRSKIERRPDAPARLLTVRGLGYRLDDGQA